ncbi:MAG: ferritin family protein [Nanoarchaeota archaeon]|nr:ferritin family protein [Nanoarchaeota archaeon]
MEMKEALNVALEYEKKGHKLYSEATNNTKNPVVAKTFKYLADQELIHIEEINEYIEQLDNGHKVEPKGDTVEETKNFFSTTTHEFKEKTELSEDDIKVHELGMELEQKAYDFYKEQYNTTKDEEAKKFFKFLMEQENVHYELIRKAYDYIKDPVGFYSEEEGWSLDGG